MDGYCRQDLLLIIYKCFSNIEIKLQFQSPDSLSKCVKCLEGKIFSLEA